MSKNSRTLIEIEDLTDTQIGPSPDGKIHILIGAEDEHQVEIVASVRTMASLAASVVDILPERVENLERELALAQREVARWVQQG